MGGTRCGPTASPPAPCAFCCTTLRRSAGRPQSCTQHFCSFCEQVWVNCGLQEVSEHCHVTQLYGIAKWQGVPAFWCLANLQCAQATGLRRRLGRSSPGGEPAADRQPQQQPGEAQAAVEACQKGGTEAPAQPRQELYGACRTHVHAGRRERHRSCTLLRRQNLLGTQSTTWQMTRQSSAPMVEEAGRMRWGL